MKTMFAEKETAMLILTLYMAVLSLTACAADAMIKK